VWSFEGGTPSSSTQQNPTVVYDTPGSFEVSLTATNAGGSDVETKSEYVTVGPFVATSRLEESEPGLRFSSGWVSALSAGARSGGAALTTSAWGVSVSMVVDGPVLRWVSTTAPWAGKALVSIDGVSAGEVDLYSASTKFQQVVFERSDLGAGSHTVVITTVGKNPVATGSWVELDAIEAVGLVQPPLPI
jgi:PKD repeat protein